MDAGMAVPTRRPPPRPVPGASARCTSTSHAASPLTQTVARTSACAPPPRVIEAEGHDPGRFGVDRARGGHGPVRGAVLNDPEDFAAATGRHLRRAFTGGAVEPNVIAAERRAFQGAGHERAQADRIGVRGPGGPGRPCDTHCPGDTGHATRPGRTLRAPQAGGAGRALLRRVGQHEALFTPAAVGLRVHYPEHATSYGNAPSDLAAGGDETTARRPRPPAERQEHRHGGHHVGVVDA